MWWSPDAMIGIHWPSITEQLIEFSFFLKWLIVLKKSINTLFYFILWLVAHFTKMYYLKLHIQVWAFLLLWQNYSWTLLNVNNMMHSNKKMFSFHSLAKQQNTPDCISASCCGSTKSLYCPQSSHNDLWINNYTLNVCYLFHILNFLITRFRLFF